jgi:hypothetical protein
MRVGNHVLEGKKNAITLGVFFPLNVNLAVDHRHDTITKLMLTKLKRTTVRIAWHKYLLMNNGLH